MSYVARPAFEPTTQPTLSRAAPPISATVCSPQVPPNAGGLLSWDNEGRLVAWQNAPSCPTSNDSFLCDSEGNRVEQQVTSGWATTSTVYVGNVEEVSSTGSTTTTTTYYSTGGIRIALAVNGSFSYLGTDGLGSTSEALDSSGNVQASVLYGPYGSVRSSSGTMPGSYGFTGQRADVYRCHASRVSPRPWNCT